MPTNLSLTVSLCVINFLCCSAATVPEILSGLKNCQAVQGKTAKFEVAVDGKPAPTVIW